MEKEHLVVLPAPYRGTQKHHRCRLPIDLFLRSHRHRLYIPKHTNRIPSCTWNWAARSTDRHGSDLSGQRVQPSSTAQSECRSSFCFTATRLRHIGQYFSTLNSFHPTPLLFCLCSRTVPIRFLDSGQKTAKTVRFPLGITAS